MKELFSIFLIYFTISNCIAQSKYPTRDSIHIFWQPELIITVQDYKGASSEHVAELMEKHQFSASASVGIWSVLDYSKNKRERSRQYEKAYFAPAFDRTTSFVKTDDSIQVKMQNTFLDICEICARWARKELKMVQDSMKAPGALTIMYMTIKDRTEQMKNGMFRAYFKDVFIDRKPNAFVEWQNLIRKRLDTTKHWATTPEECYRLMTGKPIEKGYVMAPMVVGSLNN